MSSEPNPRRSQQSAASEHRDVRRHLPATVACVTIIFTVMTGRWVGTAPPESDPQPEPTPTLDRLATPVMPESPTPVDIGRKVYYTHCMPCHGDRGQGLTDEWRAVWVEDHQNCWARGCHGGRADDEGYSIPRVVPALSGSPQALDRFQTADELFDFLRRTQPPQRPGKLPDDEYWALTAFLLHENGRLPPGAVVGTQASDLASSPVSLGAAAVGLLLVMLLAIWIGRRVRKPPDHLAR